MKENFPHSRVLAVYLCFCCVSVTEVSVTQKVRENSSARTFFQPPTAAAAQRDVNFLNSIIIILSSVQ